MKKLTHGQKLHKVESERGKNVRKARTFYLANRYQLSKSDTLTQVMRGTGLSKAFLLNNWAKITEK